MALIPPNIDKHNDIEIALDAPISEQLLNKIGANINALIDLNGNVEVFTANDTWTVPENVTRAFIYACGGGGGGAGGTFGSVGAGGLIGIIGNQGGYGSIAVMRSEILVPSDLVTITIGSGGAGQTGNGSGASGGNTIFSPTAGNTLTFYGGNGGRRGSSILNAASLNGGDILLHVQAEYATKYRSMTTVGGRYVDSNINAYSFAYDGEYDLYVGGTTNAAAAGGGGGGAGSFGTGGNGATIATGNGVSPTSTFYGAGGGAGGNTTGNGGDGAPGFLLIAW